MPTEDSTGEATKRRAIHFSWLFGLSAGPPDHLQSCSPALRRVEHQLVHEVAYNREAKPAVLIRFTREIRHAETAAVIRNAYLDAQRQDLVLDLVALHGSVADHVGYRLGNG